MKYKKVIKKRQKTKLTKVIPLNLIKGNRFEEIVALLAPNDLTAEDRYLYGYALLRTHKIVEALVVLWPLARKGNVSIQKDCALLAEYIFNNNVLSFDQLSESDLQTLFFAARRLVPQNKSFHEFKRRFLDSLWVKEDYETIERILKSDKSNDLGIVVENLSKLVFVQAEKKSNGDTRALISQVLTGATALILRTPMYHQSDNDIADAMQLLADEMKYLVHRLSSKHNLIWDQSLHNFLNHEVYVLTIIIQHFVKNKEFKVDLIPTPHYFTLYGSSSERVNTNFLNGLASIDSELCEIYNGNVSLVISWLLNGEKSGMKDVLKLIQYQKLHPYLRLALMLRMSVTSYAVSLKETVQVSDLVSFDENSKATMVFKNIAMLTIREMINNATTLPNAFWKILDDFYPLMQQPEFVSILITRFLTVLHEQYKNLDNLCFTRTQRLLQDTEYQKLKKQIDNLSNRQIECYEFIKKLSDGGKRQSKKILGSIKDKIGLSEHLTLIADSCYLLYDTVSSSSLFSHHVHEVFQNKKINKFFPLEQLLYFDYRYDSQDFCPCSTCQQLLYRKVIPQLCAYLKLSIVQLPEIPKYSDKQSDTQARDFRTLLSQEDPFKVLDVLVTDTKPIIMQRVMKLIQQSPAQMSVARQAQNELFNPSRRFVHHYFRYLAYDMYDNSEIISETHLSSKLTNNCVNKIPLREELLHEYGL